MATAKQKLSHRTWTKDKYLISTDPSLVSITDLNAVFASDTVYWTDAVPEDVMREILQNSLCFGLYQLPQTELENPSNVVEAPNGTTTALKLTGFARCVTDFTTFLYLTDVYIDPSSQGNGLGAWLISCVQEVIEGMPYLRRSMLCTGDWKRSVPFYERLMGMSVLECKKPVHGEQGKGLAVMQWRGPGCPTSLR